MKIKLDLLFISQPWARIRSDAIHLKLGKKVMAPKDSKSYSKPLIKLKYELITTLIDTTSSSQQC
jgi:hypothetical protein